MTRERQADGAGNTARPKQAIVRRVEAAVTKLFAPADKYHPEQYYLRGRPGPKAKAKAKDSDEK
jgi:hypothetical protein